MVFNDLNRLIDLNLIRKEKSPSIDEPGGNYDLSMLFRILLNDDWVMPIKEAR